jgi:aspartate dehydrogenase
MSGPAMLKIGILGVGAIGRVIAKALDERQLDGELVALADRDRARAEALSAELLTHPPVTCLDEMIERCELAVEAAGQAALPEFVPKALARGRDMLVMSVGGLLGREEWFREAAEKNCRIYVPSGAIAGLDGIKSASIGRIEMAQLTSRKPIAALQGAKYVVDRGLDLAGFKEEAVIFEGSAEEAARAFPATSNVAASLRLAVDAAVPVRVRVVAVPGGNENVHEIRVQGEFGKLTMKVENVPSKSNPKTSQLAAFSAVATLKNLTSALRVGT